MGKNKTMDNLLRMVKNDTYPALGCTEPVAVAYAAAMAKKYLMGTIEDVEIMVSKNIFKNGKSVIIPNTEESGLDLAGILGAIGGNVEDGFLVLQNIDQGHIDIAHKMIESGKIKVDYIDNTPNVYVNIIMKSSKDKVEVDLRECHTHVEWVKLNDEIVYENGFEGIEGMSTEFLKEMSFKEIIEICQTIPLEELCFIKEGVKINKEAAERGLKEGKGLGIGAAYKKMQKEGKLSMDGPTEARILTAAASDLRMGGGVCPIMTSGGSGNQGLAVVLPIVVVAEENEIEEENLLRAIFLAHIVNKYVKIYTGSLSAICGCAIAAGVGASAGISWMLDGSYEQITGACQNMLSNLTGMVCDGAKETCAFKLSTSAGEAVLSAYLANENIIAEPNVGIIGKSIEDTIKNVGILCRDGLTDTDMVIVDIMK